VTGQQRRDARLVEADAHLEAGHSRLGDLEAGRADGVAVADAGVGVRHARDGEVLTELAHGRERAVQLRLSVAVGLALAEEHRALLAAVADEAARASPSTLSRRTARRPATSSFKIADRSSRPRQVTDAGARR
jgi:hypothetical protein